MGYFNIRPEAIKLLEESMGKSSLILVLPMTIDMTAKAKINLWDHIKLKSFCIVKETINKMRWQPLEREEIFVNYISDKGLYPKYIMNFYNSIAKKQII